MAEAVPTPLNPFPGLRPFRLEEKYLFFGREKQTAELLDRLDDTRFLAVVGTSGSGKSSLVRAGLLPELHGGTMVRAGSRWEVVVMRPGGDPVENLARALAEADLYEGAKGDRVLQVEATLSRSRFGLAEAVRQSELDPGTNFLLVIDQFEEIFRFHRQSGGRGEEAADFINLLLEAARQQKQPVYVVLTMRSDFLGDCARFPGLAEAVNDGEYLIPRMDRDQCRMAIEGPVKVGGAAIAPRLVNRLLNDLGENPDQLPVLQHALMRTWDHWVKRVSDPGAKGVAADSGTASGSSLSQPMVDLTDYEAVGGMAEALSRHADEVFEELPDDRHRLMAERLFKALTERAADNRGVRRPTRLQALCAIVHGTAEEIRTTIEAYRAAGRTFLMPMEPVELQPETVIDISHESLMRVWERLRLWVEEEAQSARIYRRLAETAQLHSEERAGLYRDPDLAIARSWRDQDHPTEAWGERYHSGFSAAIQFLDASEQAKVAGEEAREAARQRELAQAKSLAEEQRLRAEEQRRSAYRLRWLVRGLGVVAMVALAAFLMAWAARKEAQESARLASASAEEARAQADIARQQKARADSAAETLRRQAYRTAVLRASSAMETGNGGDAVGFLEGTEESLRQWEWRWLNANADRSAASIATRVRSADSISLSFEARQILVSGAYGDRVNLVDPTTVPASVGGAAWRGLWVIPSAFSPDGQVFGIRKFQSVELWNGSTRERIGELATSAGFFDLTFSPDGRWVIVACLDGVVRIFDLKTGEIIRNLVGHTSSLRTAVISPDGSVLVSSANDGTIRQWNARTGEPIAVTQMVSGDMLTGVAFAPDGKRFYGVSERGALVVYSTGTTNLLNASTGTGGGWNSVALSPDGRLLAAGEGNSVAILDAESLQERDRLLAHAAFVVDLEFTRDGGWLYSLDRVGVVKAWNLEAKPTTLEMVHHYGSMRELRFSADGTRLVSGGFDNQVKVWDVDTGELQLTFSGHSSPVVAVAYHPHETMIASGDTDAELILWDTVSGKTIRTLPGHQGGVWWLDFSPDGQKLLSGGPDSSRRIWDVRTGELIHTLSGEGFRASGGARFSPDGKWVATCEQSQSGVIRIWDASTGELTRTLQGPNAEFRDIAFSSDGGALAVGGMSQNQVLMWDVDSGGLRTIATTGGIRSVAFSHDDQRLFGGDADGRVYVIDPVAGQVMLERTPGHQGGIWSVRVSPDDQTLATVGNGGRIRLWKTSDEPRVASRARWTQERAERLVQDRLRELGLTDLVVRDLQENENLDPVIRQTALDLAEAASEDLDQVQALLIQIVTDAFQATDRYQLALKLARELERLNPELNTAPFEAAANLFLDQPDAALAALDRLESAGSDAQLESGLASTCLRALTLCSLNRQAEAEALYGHVSQLNQPGESDPDALPRAMLSMARLALDDPGDDPHRWHERGRLLHRLHAADQALKAFTQAIDLAGRDGRSIPSELYLSRAALLRDLGRASEADNDEAASRGIPLRQPQTPANLLDLTPFYVASLSQGWHGQTQNTLAELLPAGRMKLDGTLFDVRGIVQLGMGGGASARFPREVRGIPAAQTAGRIHVLHSAAWENRRTQDPLPDGHSVAQYVLNYEDGTQHVIDVQIGQHLRDWHFDPEDPQQVAENQRLGAAWVGGNPWGDQNRPPSAIVVFRTTWVNPYPDKTIQSIDLESAPDNRAGAFVLAITLEP